MLCNWLQFAFSCDSAKLYALQIVLQNDSPDYHIKFTLQAILASILEIRMSNDPFTWLIADLIAYILHGRIRVFSILRYLSRYLLLDFSVLFCIMLNRYLKYHYLVLFNQFSRTRVILVIHGKYKRREGMLHTSISTPISNKRRRIPREGLDLRADTRKRLNDMVMSLCEFWSNRRELIASLLFCRINATGQNVRSGHKTVIKDIIVLSTSS